MSNILKYNEELQKDMHIDELNLSQVALSLPAIKHKWVSRLILTKSQIFKLEKRKKDYKDSIVNKIKNDTNKLSLIAIDISINENEEYKKSLLKTDEEIEELKLIVLYLEKVENIFKNMTYDLKNIIDLNKLETT
jgi:hypothetical protein